MNTLVHDDPRFRQVRDDCMQESMAILQNVIDEEKNWADYLFQKGVVIGLNANIMKSFVDWTAHARLKQIGMDYPISMKTTPLPWFNKHLNTNKKQTALQENESVSYVIGAMTSEVDYNQLPQL